MGREAAKPTALACPAAQEVAGYAQGAQKSTSTGTGDLSTSASNVASVTGPAAHWRRRTGRVGCQTRRGTARSWLQLKQVVQEATAAGQCDTLSHTHTHTAPPHEAQKQPRHTCLWLWLPPPATECAGRKLPAELVPLRGRCCTMCWAQSRPGLRARCSAVSQPCFWRRGLSLFLMRRHVTARVVSCWPSANCIERQAP